MIQVSFRNYVPKSDQLKSQIIKIDRIPSKDMDAYITEAKIEARKLKNENTPVLIAPKKVNWDLKRDIERKLKKLNKRTQLAIAEIAEELNKEDEE